MKNMKKTKIWQKAVLAALCAGLILTCTACSGTDSLSEMIGGTSSSSDGVQTLAQKEEALTAGLMKEFESNYGDVLGDVQFREIIIYTYQDIHSGSRLEDYEKEMLLEYDIGEKDIAYEVTYDLMAAEGQSIDPLLPANGEIDGNWVREKWLCGIARYVSDTEYDIVSYGTSF